MKRVLALTAVLALLGTAAAATVSNEALIGDLSGKGFTRVEIKRGLTQMQVQAIRGTVRLELVLDVETGRVLRLRIGKVRLFDNTAPGAFVASRNRDFLTAPAASGADRAGAPVSVAPVAVPAVASLAENPAAAVKHAGPVAMAMAMPVYPGEWAAGDAPSVHIDDGKILGLPIYFDDTGDPPSDDGGTMDFVIDDGFVLYPYDPVFEDDTLHNPFDPLPIDGIGDGLPLEEDDGGTGDVGIWDEVPGDEVWEEPAGDPSDETVIDDGSTGEDPTAEEPPVEEEPAAEEPAAEEPAPDDSGDEVISMPAEEAATE